MNKKNYPIGLLLLLVAVSSQTVHAGVFELSLTADGESRWYDYFSDAFGQVDQGFRDDDERDGFFLTSELPQFVPIGRGADIFPFEGDFANIGTLTYDDDTGEILNVTLDVDDFVAYNFSLINARLGDGYQTQVLQPVGQVVGQGDSVSSIALTSDIAFVYGSSPPNTVTYNGTFEIENDQFTLLVDEPVNIPGFGTFRYAWDLKGDVEGLTSVSVPGDFDADGQLTANDIDLLTNAILASDSSPQFDLNSDGQVNSSDRQEWVVELKSTYFGDANLDGEFNSSDFTAVFVVAEYEDGIPSNSGWSDGDWDGDREFASSDFVQAFQGNGYEQGPRAAVVVPEPGSGCLIVWLLCFGLYSRRHRS